MGGRVGKGVVKGESLVKILLGRVGERTGRERDEARVEKTYCII